MKKTYKILGIIVIILIIISVLILLTVSHYTNYKKWKKLKPKQKFTVCLSKKDGKIKLKQKNPFSRLILEITI
ncbi:hypothetical protein JMUB590_0258 [Staphylococcus caprae]|uniref:Uncharacterized protein n=1 Tax=Staphylococcus caprae TaxID=29380 RepID=A0ABM7FQM5_9STAP|nr:hypothetical protein JMUB590_0258 [Staphylococcus caprae]BBD93874.1 hypothetical protein JMUB898_0254 [Staphylococcus caprae]